MYNSEQWTADVAISNTRVKPYMSIATRACHLCTSNTFSRLKLHYL